MNTLLANQETNANYLENIMNSVAIQLLLASGVHHMLDLRIDEFHHIPFSSEPQFLYV